jgi:hypothetical protein
MSTMASPTGPAPAEHETSGAQQSCEPAALADCPAARPGRSWAKRAALTLAAGGSVLALSAPITAQASTRPSVQTPLAPAAAQASAAPAAAAAAPRLAAGSYTGNGGPCTFSTDVAPYECEQYSLAAPYSGCYVQVGDYYRTDRWAQGAAYVGCPAKHTYRMLLYLDVMSSSNKPDFTAVENTNGSPIYGVQENIVTTKSYCGGPARSWEMYARISIGGSAYSGYFTSQYGSFQPGAC